MGILTASIQYDIFMMFSNGFWDVNVFSTDYFLSLHHLCTSLFNFRKNHSSSLINWGNECNKQPKHRHVYLKVISAKFGRMYGMFTRC